MVTGADHLLLCWPLAYGYAVIAKLPCSSARLCLCRCRGSTEGTLGPCQDPLPCYLCPAAPCDSRVSQCLQLEATLRSHHSPWYLPLPRDTWESFSTQMPLRCPIKSSPFWSPPVPHALASLQTTALKVLWRQEGPDSLSGFCIGCPICRNTVPCAAPCLAPSCLQVSAPAVTSQ